MKRFLALALSLICMLACVFSVGCTKGLTKAQKENALIIEYYKAGYGELWIQNLAAEFTSKTGKEVVLLPRSGNEGITNMATSLTSGVAHTDLYFTSNPDFEAIYRGAALANGVRYDTWFADLTDVYDSTVEGENIKFKDKMFDAFEEYYKMPEDYDDKDKELFYSNKYYFVPWVTGMNGFVVNMNVWNSKVGSTAEFPKTTNELLEIFKSVKSEIAPLIYSLGDEYFTSFLPIFMNQYEGSAEMDRFYQGFDPNSGYRYDKDMVGYEGFLKALEFFEEMLKPANGYTHSKSVDFTFMDMQGQFLGGQALMTINGDWLEREMINNYPNAQIKMMKTPVLSSVIEKCDTINDDATLSAVIAAIDNGATSYAGVSETDFAYIAEARNMQLVTGNNTVALVPVYSNQIDAAKEFLKFMATDEGMLIFRNSTNGCELPFTYTNADNKVYADASMFRQSINEALDGSVTRFVNNKDKVFTIGGINVFMYNQGLRFVKAFTTGEKTAQKFFDDEVAAVAKLLKNANI